MNATRTQAEKTYKTALAKVKLAEMGTDLVAWEKAEAELATARTNLIAAENAFPTYAERKRSNNDYRLRNRGLDF